MLFIYFQKVCLVSLNMFSIFMVSKYWWQNAATLIILYFCWDVPYTMMPFWHCCVLLILQLQWKHHIVIFHATNSDMKSVIQWIKMLVSNWLKDQCHKKPCWSVRIFLIFMFIVFMDVKGRLNWQCAHFHTIDYA